MRYQIWNFLRLIWSEWASRVTGSLSAILVLLALGISIAGAMGHAIPAGPFVETATWVIAAVCGGQAAFAVWARERAARNEADAALGAIRAKAPIELKILFDEEDGRFVRPIKTHLGVLGERYFVGIRNEGRATLHGVTLRAHESWFVECTIAVAHYRVSEHSGAVITAREPIVAQFEHLDPGATELAELFGKDFHVSEDYATDAVFRETHRFNLEVRARDTATVVAEFEYVPNRRPMIRMI